MAATSAVANERAATAPAPYGTARGFMVSGAWWLAIGTLIGLLGAAELVAPDLVTQWPWLKFGRVRPMHISAVLFGFLVPTLLGGGLYAVPALLKRSLYSERLGRLSVVLWNVCVAAGVVTIGAGHTQAREYAEFIWPIDVGVVIVFVLLLYNVVMTIAHRVEPSLYVSVWYITGAILWTCCVYPLGNVMWRPATGSLTGVIDAIWLWFYGHNIIGLLFTPLAVGLAYFIIPRVANAPLYSHTLSLIGFWSLALIYTHIGTHHLMQAPVPLWLKVIAGIDSFMMLIPVLTVLINLWMTARGRFAGFFTQPAGKFVFAGTLWYLIVCIQGAFHSLQFVQRVTHFSNWVIAHAHIAVFGFAGMIALASVYHILPTLCGRKLYSVGLANLQYWLVIIGLGTMFIVLTMAGLVQGQAWLNGEGVYRVLPTIGPYMALRLMSGVVIFSGALVGLYNVMMTVYRGEVIES